MPTVTERYPAVVTDNQDPESRGRIKAKCAGILGDEDTALPQWIEPTFDWGWFVVPDIDEQVEIEIVVSHDHEESRYQAVLEEPDIRWRGKRFYSDSAPAHSELSQNYKRRGFATPAGHILVFDDTAGSETVTLAWKQPSSIAARFLRFTKNDATLMLDSGQLIKIDGTGVTLQHTGKLDAKVATADLINGADSFMMRGTDFATYWSTFLGVLSAWAALIAASPAAVPAPTFPPLPPTAISTVARVK